MAVNPVRTGIYKFFTTNNTSAFYIALGGRLYYDEMSESPLYPYCVFKMFDEIRDWTFDLDFEDIAVQFDYFDTTADGCDTGLINLKSLFDYAALSITGWTTLKMERELIIPSYKIEPDDIWEGKARYSILIQK